VIDYAGLFPPAALAMEPALGEYARVQAGPYAWMVRRFIAPASRLSELSAAYAGETMLPLSVILDAPNDALGWFETARSRLAAAQATAGADARLQIAALEVPLPALRSLRDTYDGAIGQYAALASATGVRDVPAYIEPFRDGRWRDALPATMTVLARHRLGAKVRCGGATAESFPSTEELAAFVQSAVAANVPFKATAGLHHPVRHADAATGFVMHGFLNIIAATLVARAGDPGPAIEAALEEEDGGAFRFDEDAFAWRDRRFDAAAIAAAREAAFLGYGSCSVDEPVEDLASMGMLGGEVPA
jgi:hypothetical protein